MLVVRRLFSLSLSSSPLRAPGQSGHVRGEACSLYRLARKRATTKSDPLVPPKKGRGTNRRAFVPPNRPASPTRRSIRHRTWLPIARGLSLPCRLPRALAIYLHEAPCARYSGPILATNVPATTGRSRAHRARLCTPSRIGIGRRLPRGGGCPPGRGTPGSGDRWLRMLECIRRGAARGCSRDENERPTPEGGIMAMHEQREQVDLLVIGGGKGGKTLAMDLAKQGYTAALLERDPEMIGGTCINVACIPTKTR